MRHEIILLIAMSKRLLFLLEARLIYPLIEMFVNQTNLSLYHLPTLILFNENKDLEFE